MKNEKIIYTLLITALILGMFSIYLNISKPLEVKTIDVKFSVDDKLGLIVNESELNFGTIFPGTSSIKYIRLTNDYNFPVKVNILISDNIHKFVFSDNEFTISVDENIKIPFNLFLQDDVIFGDYLGEIKFEFRKKPNY